MKESSFPYSVPDRRNLTSDELALLNYLLCALSKSKLDIDDVKVVARCGCGECPTIFFGATQDSEPIPATNSRVRSDWIGRANNGTLVGISLSFLNGQPTELEAWSVDGGEIEDWPSLDAIQALDRTTDVK